MINNFSLYNFDDPKSVGIFGNRCSAEELEPMILFLISKQNYHIVNVNGCCYAFSKNLVSTSLYASIFRPKYLAFESPARVFRLKQCLLGFTVHNSNSVCFRPIDLNLFKLHVTKPTSSKEIPRKFSWIAILLLYSDGLFWLVRHLERRAESLVSLFSVTFVFSASFWRGDSTWRIKKVRYIFC